MEKAKTSRDDKHHKRSCACWDSVISDGAIRVLSKNVVLHISFHNPDDGNVIFGLVSLCSLFIIVSMLFSMAMLTLAGRNITVFPVDPVLEICDVTPRPNISIWVPVEDRQTVEITATLRPHTI